MRRQFSISLTPHAACALGILAWSVAVPASAQVTFGGRATGAIVGTSRFADTEELPAEGGLVSASQAVLTTSTVEATNLNAQVSGANGVTQSGAALEGVVLLGSSSGVITIASVQAEAIVACDGETARGSSTIVGLTIGDVPIVVTGEVNQTIELEDGTLILNRQTLETFEGGRTLTVEAVFLDLNEGLDVTLASTSASIFGCGLPEDCHDFVTGGGWVLAGGEPRANFGFNAGFKPNSSTPSVHFNYIDHTTRMHFKAQTIESYEILGPTTRRFSGTGKADRVSVEYTITVTDNGEPGDADTFEILLSTGYVVGGTLEGGNIQLHKPCL